MPSSGSARRKSGKARSATAVGAVASVASQESAQESARDSLSGSGEPSSGGVPVDGRNDIALRGRLAAPADGRVLPSGDEMVSFRVVVPRPPASRRDGRRQPTVDTIECVAWSARLRRAALAWQPGATVEVEGSLRRRFWRGAAGGPASRCEVEVTAARVVR